MYRILVVEDERPISDLIEMNLSEAGYTCVCAYDGLEAANLLEKEGYDLVLLDIMLPKVSGYELLDFIKPLGIPVIFLTAKGTMADKVKGLRLGADDYLVKPFEIVELLARVEALLRRAGKSATEISIEGLTIDTRSHTVMRGSRQIPLTARNSSCCCSSCATGTSHSSARLFMSASGAASTWATPAPWTCTSSACARSCTGTTR